MGRVPRSEQITLGGEVTDPWGLAGPLAYLGALFDIVPTAHAQLDAILGTASPEEVTTKSISAWLAAWQLPVTNHWMHCTRIAWTSTRINEAISRVGDLKIGEFDDDDSPLEPAEALAACRDFIEEINRRNGEWIRELSPDGSSHVLYLPTYVWHPRRESRAEAEANALRIARKWLGIQLAFAAADCRAKFPPASRLSRTHLEWTVRYQSLGDSYATIARTVGRSRQAVMEAVRHTAALLELPLRVPDPPGRPRSPRQPRIVRKRTFR